ncbi:MAG: WecB/TagA/CpsF family glycosyltransferase [bacterium]
MNNQVKILGVPVSRLNKKQIIERIKAYLQDGQQHQLATVNPEFLLEAQQNEGFFNILNQTNLNIPDGIGLKFASWLHGSNIIRYAGSDLMQDILVMAEIQNMKVVVINWDQGLSSNSEIYQVAKRLFPNLELRVISTERDAIPSLELENYSPDILFCALGSPWQEEFVSQAIKSIQSIKVGIGIGGSFDFLTGKIKRAPQLMRALGLEWLWRLFQKPKANGKKVYKRYRRIYNAFIIFSLKAFLERLGFKQRNF